MAGQRKGRRASAGAACVLLVELMISACAGGSDSSDDSNMTLPSPVPSLAASPSSAPPSLAAPSPVPPVPVPPQSAAAAGAEAVCSSVYAGRGIPPTADSGDVDDDMALYESWHVALLQDAIAQLEPPGEADDLLAAMDEARRLGARAASIYATHPLTSQELMTIMQRQSALSDEIVPIAAAAGAPSCADLVALP